MDSEGLMPGWDLSYSLSHRLLQNSTEKPATPCAVSRRDFFDSSQLGSVFLMERIEISCWTEISLRISIAIVVNASGSRQLCRAIVTLCRLEGNPAVAVREDDPPCRQVSEAALARNLASEVQVTWIPLVAPIRSGKTRSGERICLVDVPTCSAQSRSCG
jgi:hypothetical protein